MPTTANSTTTERTAIVNVLSNGWAQVRLRGEGQEWPWVTLENEAAAIREVEELGLSYTTVRPTPEPSTLSQLVQCLENLNGDRINITELRKHLGITRAKLQTLITRERDALALADVVLHTATVSQASLMRLYITVDGRRVAALSWAGGAR